MINRTKKFLDLRVQIISSNAAFTTGAAREGFNISRCIRLPERVKSRGVETPISTAVLFK